MIELMTNHLLITYFAGFVITVAIFAILDGWFDFSNGQENDNFIGLFLLLTIVWPLGLFVLFLIVMFGGLSYLSYSLKQKITIYSATKNKIRVDKEEEFKSFIKEADEEVEEALKQKEYNL